jgi:hypothetical protein
VSIWFSSGCGSEDATEDLWNGTLVRRENYLGEVELYARVVAARLLGADVANIRMNADGTLSYTNLKRPIGSHSRVFATLYADDVRIMRGHHGTTFVFSQFLPSRMIEDRLLILADCPTVICSND